MNSHRVERTTQRLSCLHSNWVRKTIKSGFELLFSEDIRFRVVQDNLGMVDLEDVVVVAACERNFRDMYRSVAWADQPGSFGS